MANPLSLKALETLAQNVRQMVGAVQITQKTVINANNY